MGEGDDFMVVQGLFFVFGMQQVVNYVVVMVVFGVVLYYYVLDGVVQVFDCDIGLFVCFGYFCWVDLVVFDYGQCLGGVLFVFGGVIGGEVYQCVYDVNWQFQVEFYQVGFFLWYQWFQVFFVDCFVDLFVLFVYVFGYEGWLQQCVYFVVCFVVYGQDYQVVEEGIEVFGNEFVGVGVVVVQYGYYVLVFEQGEGWLGFLLDVGVGWYVELGDEVVFVDW